MLSKVYSHIGNFNQSMVRLPPMPFEGDSGIEGDRRDDKNYRCNVCVIDILLSVALFIIFQ